MGDRISGIASGQHFFPNQQLMATATSSLHKNFEEILHNNGLSRKAVHKKSMVDSQQGGDTYSQGATRPEDTQFLLAEGAKGSPIYFKEHTVANDDKLYEVMILIKEKDNTSRETKLMVDLPNVHKEKGQQIQFRKALQDTDHTIDNLVVQNL